MIMVYKYVGTFEVPVHNVQIMQGFQTVNNLNCYFPKFIFCKSGFVFLILLYFLIKVTVVGVFHYDAQIGAMICSLINEGLIVLDYITIVPDTG